MIHVNPHQNNHQTKCKQNLKKKRKKEGKHLPLFESDEFRLAEIASTVKKVLFEDLSAGGSFMESSPGTDVQLMSGKK